MNTLKRSERAWLDDFFRLASPENVRDLLIEINDHLQCGKNFLNDAPLTDLADQISEIEDAIFDSKEPEPDPGEDDWNGRMSALAQHLNGRG